MSPCTPSLPNYYYYPKSCSSTLSSTYLLKKEYYKRGGLYSFVNGQTVEEVFAQALEVEKAMEEADWGLLEAHLIAQVGANDF